MRLASDGKASQHRSTHTLYYVWVVLAAAILLSPGPAPAGGVEERRKIEDDEIIEAIEADLLISRIVAGHLIDVECSDGIVTLRGSAGNILEKEQAVRLAQSFKGVRSVVDLIEVRPVLRTDPEILEAVKSAITSDPATELYEISVKVEDGVVILTGTVDSMAEKDLTGSVAKSVLGVRSVDNDINVYFASTRPDGEIKKEIEKRFEYNPYLYAGLLYVDVEDGNVSLTGSVGSSAEKVRAYSDAWVAGVRMVDTEGVEVKWWLTKRLKRESDVSDSSDEGLESAIERALANDPRVFSFEIDVAVDKGVATLRGTVDNLKAKRAAKRDAANTFGIAWVENYIKVRPEIVPPDDKLKHRVSNSLILDPLVERYDLTVVVRNGKVYVYGYVDSFYERFHVDDVISRVMGVAEVQNNVSVNYPYLYVTDSRIEREIRKNLLWSTLVDAGDISVSVQNGTATLSGTVDEWREYKAVIDNAFEGGARRVESNIRIAGQPDWKPPHHFLYEDFFGEIR